MQAPIYFDAAHRPEDDVATLFPTRLPPAPGTPVPVSPALWPGHPCYDEHLNIFGGMTMSFCDVADLDWLAGNAVFLAVYTLSHYQAAGRIPIPAAGDEPQARAVADVAMSYTAQAIRTVCFAGDGEAAAAWMDCHPEVRARLYDAVGRALTVAKVKVTDPRPLAILLGLYTPQLRVDVRYDPMVGPATHDHKTPRLVH